MNTISSKLAENGFSEREIRSIANMKQGDENNKKGNFYEKSFIIYQMLQQTKDSIDTGKHLKDLKDENDIVFSNDEIATVDDLCIRFHRENKRYNYQLKNSPTTGKWNDRLADQFALQDKLDQKIHQVTSSTHTLVCSDKEVANSNDCCFQSRYDGKYQSLYFPSYETLFELLKDENIQIKELLSTVCPDSSQHETALRMIGSIQQESVHFKKSLGEWWTCVLESSKPSLFSISSSDIGQINPKIIEHLQKNNFCINAAAFVYKNSFSITLTTDFLEKLANPSISKQILDCSAEKDILNLLLKLASVGEDSSH